MSGWDDEYLDEELQAFIAFEPNNTGSFQFEDETIEMKPGDFMNIPAHEKHRVEWTTPDEPTIWLALFYGGEQQAVARCVVG